MNTWGSSLLGYVTVGLFVTACAGGAAETPPANTPSSTTMSSGDAPKQTPKQAPAQEEAAPPKEATPAPAPVPEKEATPDPCDGEWICLKVEKGGKVSKRPTRLIGDPKIETTWSKNTDGRSPASFDDASTPVDITLEHIAGKPGQHLAQVALKPKAGGAKVILDKRDGDEFSYVGFVAAEQDGAFLVDFRYMK